MSVFEAMANADVPDPNRQVQDPDAPAQASKLVPPSLQEPPPTLEPADFQAPESDSVVAEPVVVANPAPVPPVPVVVAPDADWGRTTDYRAPVAPMVVADDAPPEPSMAAPVPGRERLPQRTLLKAFSIAFAVLLVALLAIGGFWLLTGGRYYIVTTPSMSPALPVGSLVLTKPYVPTEVQTGTIIAFVAPQGVSRMYTHRVVAVTQQGYVTKGDANLARDPWPFVPFSNVRGIVVADLVGVGWLVRALPFLLIGLLIAMAIAALVPWRWGVFMPLIAMVIVLSVPLLILKPLVRGEFVGRPIVHSGVTHNRVVNTGLLPLKFVAEGQQGVHVAPGHWADIVYPSPPNGQAVNISATVDLTLMGWIVLGLLCAFPLIIGIAVALREWRKDRRGTLLVTSS